MGGTELVKVHTVFNISPLIPDLGDATTGAQVEIPDVFAGERKDLLIELKVPQLPEGAEASSSNILRASVCYFDMSRRTTVLAPAVTMNLERRPASETEPEVEPDDEVADQRQRVEVTNARETAIDLCDQGDFEEAQERLAGCQ